MRELWKYAKQNSYQKPVLTFLGIIMEVIFGCRQSQECNAVKIKTKYRIDDLKGRIDDLKGRIFF